MFLFQLYLNVTIPTSEATPISKVAIIHTLFFSFTINSYYEKKLQIEMLLLCKFILYIKILDNLKSIT